MIMFKFLKCITVKVRCQPRPLQYSPRFQHAYLFVLPPSEAALEALAPKRL